MLVIYTVRGCEKVANAISQGAADIETLVTHDPMQVASEYAAICISKNLLGGEAKEVENRLHSKKTYIVGIGFNFEQMRHLAERLKTKNAAVENTLCLKRKNVLPISAEVSEVEMERARAFGERIARTITKMRPFVENEKNRIPRYYKQGF